MQKKMLKLKNIPNILPGYVIVLLFPRMAGNLWFWI